MKFRVFDNNRKDVTDQLAADMMQMLDPDRYTVVQEPDYQVCGNCKNLECDSYCDQTFFNCIRSRPGEWHHDKNQSSKPCEHWEFCGVTE